MNHKRVILGVLLAISIILLILYSSQEYRNKDPDFNYILENFETYNNTKITITGLIKKINTTSQTLTIRLQESPFSLFEIKTDELEDLHKSDIIGISGILDGKNHVTAEEIWIYKQWANDLILIRSIPAIPFALYLFLKTWQFKRRTFRFERRKRDA